MSEFTRKINASATITLDGYTAIPIFISYEYTEDAAPTVITFNFTDSNGVTVGGGQFANSKIVSYNVNNGIADSAILTVLQTKLIDIYTNYKTI